MSPLYNHNRHYTLSHWYLPLLLLPLFFFFFFFFFPPTTTHQPFFSYPKSSLGLSRMGWQQYWLPWITEEKWERRPNKTTMLLKNSFLFLGVGCFFLFSFILLLFLLLPSISLTLICFFLLRMPFFSQWEKHIVTFNTQSCWFLNL